MEPFPFDSENFNEGIIKLYQEINQKIFSILKNIYRFTRLFLFMIRKIVYAKVNTRK